MKTLKEIREILEKHKEELKQKYFIKEIGIFGSYVRDEQREDSDIDILVEFEKPIDFFIFLELEEVLTELLGTKVELVMKRAIKPHLGKFILKEVQYV